MKLSTPIESGVFVVLFALALGGFLWAAWQPGRMTAKRGFQTLAFAALVAVDIAIITSQS